MNRERLQALKRNFDAVGYLDDLGVVYSREGDNVSEGWVNMPCCFCADHADHLGMNLESGRYHCWLCDETGDSIHLVMALESCHFNRALERLGQYQRWMLEEGEREEIEDYRGRLLPEKFELIENLPAVPKPVRGWLGRRGFPESLCREHGLGWVRHGEYALRLIVPVYVGGQSLSWQAVDVTGKADAKYVSCPNRRSAVPLKHLVYGLDWLRGEQLVVVEGVTDKWRIGRDAVSLFGKQWTDEQLFLLFRHVPADRPVKVLLDRDALSEAERLAARLTWHFRDVRVMELEVADDPADLWDSEVRKIMSN